MSFSMPLVLRRESRDSFAVAVNLCLQINTYGECISKRYRWLYLFYSAVHRALHYPRRARSQGGQVDKAQISRGLLSPTWKSHIAQKVKNVLYCISWRKIIAQNPKFGLFCIFINKFYRPKDQNFAQNLVLSDEIAYLAWPPCTKSRTTNFYEARQCYKIEV